MVSFFDPHPWRLSQIRDLRYPNTVFFYRPHIEWTSRYFPGLDELAMHNFSSISEHTCTSAPRLNVTVVFATLIRCPIALQLSMMMVLRALAFSTAPCINNKESSSKKMCLSYGNPCRNVIPFNPRSRTTRSIWRERIFDSYIKRYGESGSPCRNIQLGLIQLACLTLRRTR